jgi:hypothetical protein
MNKYRKVITEPGEVINYRTVYEENTYLRTGVPEKMGFVERLDYTTSVYENGITYNKRAYVYLPYCYDKEDKSRKYNVLYFQHGNTCEPAMFAVGGNMEAAAVSGVNVAKTIMLVYLLAGVLYGIASFLEAARITSVGANTGINYELDAISAVVVGGVSFSGGVGTIQGVVIGAVIMQAIVYALQFLGVNPYIQYIIRGLIIILAVSIDVRKYIVKK